ncbi:type VII secretion target [Actinoplanes sp. NPDC049265]|uniref:type VII secretion target n=1 Tax=Actinoplanes sp. NPDC049265 TaxID=3363902 RepID=UPI0037130565
MTDFMVADTGGLREVADRLDPAAATAAKAAATTARQAALVCGDPMPGCQAFSAAVGRVADEIIAFCTTVEAGVPAYASAVRGGAGFYDTAENDAAQGVPGGTV